MFKMNRIAIHEWEAHEYTNEDRSYSFIRETAVL